MGIDRLVARLLVFGLDEGIRLSLKVGLRLAVGVWQIRRLLVTYGGHPQLS